MAAWEIRNLYKEKGKTGEGDRRNKEKILRKEKKTFKRHQS